MIRHGFAFLIVVNWLSPSVQAQTTTVQTTPVAADSQFDELKETIDRYVADYSTGQVDQVMSYWDEEADFVDIRGRFHEGRDLIAALFRRGFADNPGRTLRLNSASRKFLSPQVAMDDGILELSTTDGETSSGRYTVVWIKKDGKWVIRSARDIPIEVEEVIAESQGPALEQLAWLVGKWQAKTDDYNIDLNCDWTLDKNFLIQNFNVKASDEEFRVVTYIAFDPSEAHFRSWFFDSRGGFGTGWWTQEDGVDRVASAMVLPSGQLGSSVMTWQRLDDDHLTWQALEREVAGESLPDTKQTYTRVK